VIRKAGVIGMGTMGSGIAQVISMAGIDVYVYDVSEDSIKRGMEKIDNSLQRLKKKGKLNDEKIKNILGRIQQYTDVKGAVRECDLVIEAVPEVLELKKDLFSRIEKYVETDTVLATNTSGISVTSIADSLEHTDRLLGMHWFNPPVLMPLVEIIKGKDTSAATVSEVVEFVRNIGKEDVVCKDSPGFIVTRTLGAFLAECLKIEEEGIATIEEIDKAVKLGLNHPMGPFELSDYNGLDVVLNSLSDLYEHYGDRFRPTEKIQELVGSGKLGRKSGIGFYTY